MLSGISDLILASRTAANRDASLVPMFLAGSHLLDFDCIVTILAKKLRRSTVTIDRGCHVRITEISIRGLVKANFVQFQSKIPEKQILAIVGPSGGGKTTLLRMLAGLETIDSGQIFYNGEPLELDELEKRNLLGFVFQDFQLFPHFISSGKFDFIAWKTMGMKQEDAEKKARGLWNN